MGKQIGFYLNTEDYSDLLDLFEELDLVALSETVESDTPIRVLDSEISKKINPHEFTLTESQYFYYLMPNKFGVVDIIYNELNDEPNIYKVDSWLSPVIEFKPSVVEHDKVFDGRLYMNLEKSSSLYPIVETAYRKLHKHIKAWNRTSQYGFYVGPKTAEAVRNGECKIMHHKLELDLQ